MRRAAFIAAAACALTATTSARAQEHTPAKRVEVGTTLGFAMPVGSAEAGARVSDTTIGIVPLGIDAAYALTQSIGLVVAGAYALTIPTLCRSASDCEASVGSDVTLSLGVRARLSRLGPATPRLDVGLGYEWLTTRLAERGVTSTRSYEGPLVAIAELSAPLRIGRACALGPVFGAMLGVFTSEGLDTGAFRRSGSVLDPTLHAWPVVRVRLGFQL